VFFINLPNRTRLILILAPHVAENTDRESSRVDWFGAILAALGLGALVYGLIESARVGFNDRSVIMALVAGLSVLILFFVVESRLSHPMLPLTLFRRDIRWNESLNISALCCPWRNTFFPAVEFDSGSAVLTDFRWRGAVAVHTDLCSFRVGPAELVARYGPKLPLVVGPVITSRLVICFSCCRELRQLLDKFFFRRRLFWD